MITVSWALTRDRKRTWLLGHSLKSLDCWYFLHACTAVWTRSCLKLSPKYNKLIRSRPLYLFWPFMRNQQKPFLIGGSWIWQWSQWPLSTAIPFFFSFSSYPLLMAPKDDSIISLPKSLFLSVSHFISFYSSFVFSLSPPQVWSDLFMWTWFEEEGKSP